MAIIRQASAKEAARSAIVLDLGDVRRQGELMIERAKREAESIVGAARNQRERILAGATEEGRAAGFAQGLAEGRSEGEEAGRAAGLEEMRTRLEAVEKGWSEALGDFVARRERMLAEARRDVLRLAAGVGERVVKRVVALDENVVVDQLAAVLELVTQPTQLVVAMNPGDRPVAERALPGLLGAYQAAREVQFVEDAGLERGGCVARLRRLQEGAESGPGGEIDASITTQLERIIEALLPGDRPAETAPNAAGDEGGPQA
jgi:flagellar assembly protein FliH